MCIEAESKPKVHKTKILLIAPKNFKFAMFQFYTNYNYTTWYVKLYKYVVRVDSYTIHSLHTKWCFVSSGYWDGMIKVYEDFKSENLGSTSCVANDYDAR